MSRAMTADELVKAYEAEGLTVHETTLNGKSWRNNNRNFKHSSAQNLNGQIMHHTGPWSTVSGIVRILFEGRSDLPGPLCTDGIDPEGIVWMIGNGWSNHAGNGSVAVLNAIIADEPTPATGPDVVDGNAHLYGDEVINNGDGKQRYPNRQFEAVVKVHTARARHHGWKEYSSILHKTWTRRKPDAYGQTEAGDTISLSFLQSEVKKALALPPGEYRYHSGTPAPKPPAPKPPTPQKEPTVSTDPTWNAVIPLNEPNQKELGWASPNHKAGDLVTAALIYAHRAWVGVSAIQKDIAAIRADIAELKGQK